MKQCADYYSGLWCHLNRNSS